MTKVLIAITALLLITGVLISCRKRESEKNGSPPEPLRPGQDTAAPDANQAEDSGWRAYMTEVGGKLASVFVDTSAGQCGPRTLDHLITVCLQANEVRDNGLPSSEDFDRVCDLEERIRSELESSRFRSVGRVTAGGIFELYFYCAQIDQFLPRVEQLAKGTGLSIAVEEREDPNWAIYKDRLYPSPEAWRQIKDLQVLEALRDAGDDLMRLRQVDHWLYFASSTAREEAADQLVADGFDIADKGEEKGNERPWSLHVSRVDSVRPQDISNLTVSLMHLAEEHAGEYDGWETSVEK